MKSAKELFRVSEKDKVNLKLNLIKARQDQMFEKLINELDANDDLLMDYTSSLQDAVEERKHCLHCPGLTNCPNKIKGYLYTPSKEENTIVFSYVACPLEQSYLQNHDYEKYVTFFDIPKNLKEASIKNIYVDDKKRLPVIKYIKDFMVKYLKGEEVKGLYLYGSFGSGKTYLVTALFNELAKKNVTSAIVYYPEFLQKLRSSFQTDFDEKLNYIKNVPLLLLDDIGAENVTSWSRDEILAILLRHRMENDLPTFFTSNCSLDQLEEHLSRSTNGVEKLKAARLMERVKYLTTPMELTTTNRRN